MKYLIIDGSLHGTGIRDKYKGGYIEPNELELPLDIVVQIHKWVSAYEQLHYEGFNDKDIICQLDNQGKNIARLIKQFLPKAKVEYFSSALLKIEQIL